MVMVCVCVCSLMVMVCVCVLTDVGKGCGTVNDQNCELHMVFVVAYHFKFTSHVLLNKVVARLTGV